MSAQLHANGERGPQGPQNHERKRGQRHRMGEVEVPRTTATLSSGKNYDVHPAPASRFNFPVQLTSNMQKKPHGDKVNTGSSSRITSTRRPQSRNSLDSVKDLLQRSTPVLAGLQREALRQRDWLQWLQRELPADLAGHLTGAAEQAGALVIFAESAGWGVRLRYAAPQLLEAMDAAHMNITAVRVRIVPRGAGQA